jgi:hypothetical protein
MATMTDIDQHWPNPRLEPRLAFQIVRFRRAGGGAERQRTGEANAGEEQSCDNSVEQVGGVVA